MSLAQYHHDGATITPTRPASPTPVFAGLVACPAAVVSPVMAAAWGDWAGSIYRIAYERALAAQRPSPYEQLRKSFAN